MESVKQLVHRTKYKKIQKKNRKLQIHSFTPHLLITTNAIGEKNAFQRPEVKKATQKRLKKRGQICKGSKYQNPTGPTGPMVPPWVPWVFEFQTSLAFEDKHRVSPRPGVSEESPLLFWCLGNMSSLSNLYTVMPLVPIWFHIPPYTVRTFMDIKTTIAFAMCWSLLANFLTKEW